MAQWVRTFVTAPDELRQSPSPRGVRRELTASGCPLTSTDILWHSQPRAST